MSTLENTVAEERLYEAFEIDMVDNYDLQDELAYKTLSTPDYYEYCKFDAWDKLDIDYIWKGVLEEFYACEGTCYNIQELATRAFNLDL